MAESLTVPGGTTVDLSDPTEVDRAFARAMAAPEASEPLAPAPRRREAREETVPVPTPSEAKHDKPRVESGPRPRVRPSRAKGKATPKPSDVLATRDYSADLQGICQLAFGALVASGNLADAGAVAVHGPGMCAAWNTAAQENAMVRRGVEWLTKGGVWGAVIVATMPFALQIGANHNQVPVERVSALGVKEPVKLAAIAEEMAQEMAESAASQTAA